MSALVIAAIAVGACMIGFIVGSIYSNRQRRASQPEWRVRTLTGETTASWERPKDSVTVYVTPKYGGLRHGFLIGDADPSASDYEDRMAELRAQAEDRIAKLIATGVHE